MARPRRIDSELVEYARAVVATATNPHELRTAQSILLPATLGATLEQTASLLGVGRATVPRLQARFRERLHSGGLAPPGRGGRRHALMSLDEEQAFLAAFEERARAGGVLVVSDLREALAQRLGRSVAPSVIYRLLERHGWRKVAPDTRHPKSDPEAQEAWKKNSPKRWQPC